MTVPATMASKLSLRTVRFFRPKRLLDGLGHAVLVAGLDLVRVGAATDPEARPRQRRHDGERVALTGLNPVTGATLRSPQVEPPLAPVVSLDEPPLLPHAANPTATATATVATPSLRRCTNHSPSSDRSPTSIGRRAALVESGSSYRGAPRPPRRARTSSVAAFRSVERPPMLSRGRRQELGDVRQRLRVLVDEEVTALVAAELGVRDATGDGLAVRPGRHAVVRTARDERGRR